MAFRIHNSVDRGEIDNRVKGAVRGRIWLHGRNEPLVLDLNGNAWPDLAGCLLTFVNLKPQPSRSDIEGLAASQKGGIGDLTASRKVRVWGVSVEEACDMLRRKEKPPEHMANSLYLEWFSDANGRVVIESVDYDLEISAPEWCLTSEEETQRGRDAAQGMNKFMNRLSKAVEHHRNRQEDPDEPWDEFGFEKFLKEAAVGRYQVQGPEPSHNRPGGDDRRYEPGHRHPATEPPNHSRQGR